MSSMRMKQRTLARQVATYAAVAAAVVFVLVRFAGQQSKLTEMEENVARLEAANEALEKSISSFRVDNMDMEDKLKKAITAAESAQKGQQDQQQQAPRKQAPPPPPPGQQQRPKKVRAPPSLSQKEKIELELPPEHPIKDVPVNGLSYKDIMKDIFVINLDTCPTRWKLMNEWASSVGLTLQRYPALLQSQVDLKNPPGGLKIELDFEYVTSGQVGVFHSQYAIWQKIVDLDLKWAFIMEDDVYFKNNTLEMLPQLMANVEAESAKRGKPWHYIFFRRHALQNTSREERWCDNPRGGSVTISVPAWGNAAYMVSQAGARYLVDHMKVYRQPIDVQLARLQADNQDYITLSACDNDHVRPLCPEAVGEIPRSLQAECGGSGTQAGKRLTKKQLQELIANSLEA